MEKRLYYFDVIKLLCIMWIFFVHFIAEFRPTLFEYWTSFPTSLFLDGVTGKFATAFFAVILGYLAYYKGSQEEQLPMLIIKRYLVFFVMGLFANTIYSLHITHSFLSISTIKDILIASIKIDSNIFATFWCMKSFFFGSMLSYINGKYTISFFPICLQIAIFMLIGDTWIAICLLGNILYRIVAFLSCQQFKKIITKPLMQILMILIVFFAIKRPESESTYFIDGICAVLLLVLISIKPKLQNMLSNRSLAYLGKNCMGIFILHPTVYKEMGPLILSFFSDSLFAFWATFIICVMITIPLAIILVFLINKCSNLLLQLVRNFKNLLVFYFKIDAHKSNI